MLCENCREKYVKNNRGHKQQSGKFSAGTHKKGPFIKPPVSPSTSDHDIHLIMKNNALFLLELASSSDSGIEPKNPTQDFINPYIVGMNRRRLSTSTMPPVSENSSPPDFSGPFGPVPPFHCLQALGVNYTNDEPPIYERLFQQNFNGFSFTSTSGNQRVSKKLPTLIQNLNHCCFFSRFQISL